MTCAAVPPGEEVAPSPQVKWRPGPGVGAGRGGTGAAPGPARPLSPGPPSPGGKGCPEGSRDVTEASVPLPSEQKGRLGRHRGRGTAPLPPPPQAKGGTGAGGTRRTRQEGNCWACSLMLPRFGAALALEVTTGLVGEVTGATARASASERRDFAQRQLATGGAVARNWVSLPNCIGIIDRKYTHSFFQSLELSF